MARPWPASEGENMKPSEGKHETPNGPGPGGVDHGATMVSPRNSGRCGSWRVHGQPHVAYGGTQPQMRLSRDHAWHMDTREPSSCAAHSLTRVLSRDHAWHMDTRQHTRCRTA